jgi:germination protein M
MKKFMKKRFFIFLFPVIAICITVGALVFSNNEELEHSFVVDVKKDQTYRKVYMLDNDNYLVPLTFAFDSKEILADDIRYVISMLRDDSPLTEKGYSPLLNENVKIQGIDLENNILNIDFSKEFNEYDVSKEEQIIESLTWTLMQYDEVNGVTISVDGIKLETLPQSGTVLPSVLDKTIGINKYYDTTGNIYNTTSITVFYEKENFGETVYVPVTRRVIEEENEKMSVYNAMKEDISVMSGLKRIDVIDLIDEEMSINFNEDELNVALMSEALMEEGVIDNKIYELLVMTYADLNDISVSFTFEVDEEEVSVNGYQKDEDYKVSSIIINEVKM